ncbi:amino acid adenylation domain-containing protein, partial [Methanobrevibacter sp.]
MRYNFYPFRLLANKYDVKSDVLFQFLPDWVMDTNDLDVDDRDIGKDDLFDDMGDLIADLSVEIIQRGNDYLLSVVYCDKYSKDFIDRFVESYKLIFKDMLSVGKLSDICYVSCDDLVLLDEFNDTEHDLLYDDVLDAFNDNLSRYPDNMLVSYEDCSYTYGEGAFIANEIASSLKARGIEVQDKVAFLVERSELYMFCVLGVLSGGGVYVPLDDKLPDDRIRFILEDTDCGIVIVSDETYDRVVGLVDGDVVLLNISDIVNGEVGCLSSLSVVYGDLACILYTSGSTGVPKGVKITRKSVLNLSEFYVDNYFFTKDSVHGLFASIGFDACYESIFASIYVGACLSVIPDNVKLDMFKLNDYFVQQNITHTFMSTKLGEIFMEIIEDTSLKFLSVGGEKLGVFEYPVNYCLMDGFGPTEAFDFISSINFDDKIDPFSVGFLNYNTKVYVLDNEYRRIPVGAVGELYLAGYQIADGYLNRPDEDEKSFIKNPFDDDEGYGVLYRTGDLVRFLPDGSLGIVGRRDGQVKVRGNRVELSEVEAVIRELDFVENVTVQTVKNGSNNELVAYVVSNNEDIDGIVEDIRAYVASRKPDYMVPSFVVRLDEVPLTVNGKVDKSALPDVDFGSL